MQATQEKSSSSWLDRPLFTTVTLNWEVVLFGAVVVLFILTRFYDLGARVMSHDESLHTYYSWLLYDRGEFTHTPLMHGPLQFHLLALSYFLIGDSDFSARLPAVLASIASILLLWNFRRYLKRTGTLIAAVMFLISPYLLFYGRYVRNEAFIVPLGLLTIWTILRYLESGENRYLFYLTGATVLHFTIKETAFIYTAQALLFLGIYFVNQITKRTWPRPDLRRMFIIALLLTFLLGGAALGVNLISHGFGTISAAETAAPAIPGEGDELLAVPAVPSVPTIVLLIFGLIALVVAIVVLIRGYTWKMIRAERSFDLLILLGTLVLPQLAPFPVQALGWDPLDYSSTGMLRTSFVLVPLILVTVGIGLWWNPRVWLINAAMFYAVFVVFYTTIFTNGGGFFTGMVGSLGYWLDQQGVRRGSQPWYYYLFLQVPVYEYLPALGSLLALYLGLRPRARRAPEEPAEIEGDSPAAADQPATQAPVLPLLGFWTITSIAAYTLAGEKMPWLTVHMTWPMILLAGWALGQLVNQTDWPALWRKRGLLVILLLPAFLTSLTAVIGSLIGTNPPFQGSELEQLQATSTFLMAALTVIGSGWGLAYLLREWNGVEIWRVVALTVFSLLGILTARAAFISAYINYDDATEYLVYAHSARGVKDVMDQVQDISRRTTDGLALQVAYDDDVSWPFTWYLRNYTNQRYYAKSPTRDLSELPVILVGDDNFAAVQPIVGQAFYQFEYIRMVWPDQDYFNMTWERIVSALRNPEMRRALFDIWLNRDYTRYAQLANKDLSLPNWTPSDRMRMYVRKDVAAKLWDYGVGPAPEEVVADPYEGGGIELAADRILGGPGSEAGLFQAPRGIAVAPDGSLYIADSRNNRIQHLDLEGNVLHSWGSFADAAAGAAPGGTFNEPWGVAVDSGGNVYVADTWNHRVQKFTAQGDFIAMWGYFGQAEDAYAYWGPRDIAVDAFDRVLITDTGNKRVVVLDQDGTFVTEIGGAGFLPGTFNEPIGVVVSADGLVFVADTWNQRIQSLMLDETGLIPVNSWDIAGWYGQSLENKPYITVDDQSHVFITDPEGFRVIEFTAEGNFIRYWGALGDTPGSFNLPTGIAADNLGGLWVTDAGNNQIIHFTLP